MNETQSLSSSNIVTDYFRKIWNLLTDPAEFCKTEATRRNGMTEPLVFALVSHWLGQLVAFTWSGTLGIAIGSRINSWFSQLGQMFEDRFGAGQIESLGRYADEFQLVDLFSNWMYGFATVLIDPFITIGKIFLYAAFVFVGSKLIIGPSIKTNFESAVRVVSYATAVSILAAIPLAGTMISFLYGVAVTVIAAREIYQVETGRAFIVGLFPQILSFLFFLFIAIVLLFGLAIAFA